jgi:hypothetical protein
MITWQQYGKRAKIKYYYDTLGRAEENYGKLRRVRVPSEIRTVQLANKILSHYRLSQVVVWSVLQQTRICSERTNVVPICNFRGHIWKIYFSFLYFVLARASN